MAARQIGVTHVGSLPRGDELTALLVAKDHGKPYDAAEFDGVVQNAVDDAVAKQVGRRGLDCERRRARESRLFDLRHRAARRLRRAC